MSHLAKAPAPPSTENRILDAAYQQVMAVGVRRTTLTDVADRAGLSRMTVYRRFPDVGSVLQALMWREFGALLERADDAAAEHSDALDQIVAYTVSCVALLTSDRLYCRLLDVDPELMLPYLIERPGRFQAAVSAELERRLVAAIDAGAVRRDDPARLARSINLAARGFGMAIRDGSSSRQRERERDDLARMVRGLLDPRGAA